MKSNLRIVGIASRRVQSGLLADVGERAVAVVAVEGVRPGLELRRGADVALDVVCIAGTLRVVGERPVDVLADVQVGEAVAVEVRPAALVPQKCPPNRPASRVTS